MRQLCKEICDIIEDRDDLTFSKVAERIGASKQCMSKFKDKGVIGFRKLLRLSYLLFPTTQRETMAIWCLKVNTTETIKQSFEYAAITRNLGLLNSLIKKYSSEGGSIGEYVAIYTIIYKYMIDEISGYNLILNIKKAGTIKDNALSILIEILKCYNYYFQKKFPLMLETAKEAEEMIKTLSGKNLFMKECLLHRVAELFGPIFLRLNNLALARHYAFIITNANICAKTVSDAFYIVGMTYLIEDPLKCIGFLQDSYEISKTVGDINREKESRLNLDFAKLYSNVNLDDDSDLLLRRYQENKDSENLKLVEEGLYQGNKEDFLVFFRACHSDSVNSLYECHKRFFSQSNYHFASLVAREIQKKWESSTLIETLINFKYETEGNVCFEKNFISCFSSYSYFSRSRSSCA